MEVNIKGLSQAAVLKALHENSKAQGMSYLALRELSLEECQSFIDEGQTYFDYLCGKVMKVDLSGDAFDPWGYDRDNGSGAAQRAVDSVRNK
jgi:hypothetical protein